MTCSPFYLQLFEVESLWSMLLTFTASILVIFFSKVVQAVPALEDLFKNLRKLLKRPLERSIVLPPNLKYPSTYHPPLIF